MPAPEHAVGVLVASLNNRCNRIDPWSASEAYTPNEGDILHHMKRIKFLLTAAMAAMAISAVFVAAAGAEVVPAKFSSTGFKLTTAGITL